MSIIHLIHFLVPHDEEKKKTELVGHLDDFCPICRQIATFTVFVRFTQNVRVTMLVSVENSREDEVRFMECGGCHGRWRLSDGFLSSGPASSEEPRRLFEQRNEIEGRAKNLKTTPAERTTLILEPLRFMGSMAELHRTF